MCRPTTRAWRSIGSRRWTPARTEAHVSPPSLARISERDPKAGAEPAGGPPEASPEDVGHLVGGAREPCDAEHVRLHLHVDASGERHLDVGAHPSAGKLHGL